MTLNIIFSADMVDPLLKTWIQIHIVQADKESEEHCIILFLKVSLLIMSSTNNGFSE